LCPHPDILECCVTGIPDEEFDFLIAALVVKDSKSSVTELEIENFLNSKVQDAKKLRGGVYFVDTVPQTPSGKPRRKDAQQIVIGLYNERNKINKK
jgi:acyl-coenzyme A synthetase/AMP-(fatty) acid ligase